MSQWIDPYAGFVYQDDPVKITAVHQQEKLDACGIDPKIFGTNADPSFFIGLAIHAGIKSGITAEGNINMLQALTQHRPVLLDEPLVAQGHIADVREVPRGRTLHTEVNFVDTRGQVAISANRVSLKPDPTKAGTRGAGARPEPVITDTKALILGERYQLTPAGVRAYSSEGNSIHYEEDAARAAGFRAPLIGGGMGVHFLMAALWQQRPPQTLHADIYFRRPIFWDEAVRVGWRGEAKPNAMALLKPDGKIGTELALHNLES